ncbi:MAG: L-alanine-DL-glutamate epimerase-like enolase superfamily enzyme [Saprospiraceae bacterium]|jgi:L-alanine-DL-glutamate epimerase-like enolase superfamily enzyme
MTITQISFERLDLKLSKPYTIAYEVVEFATNFILKVETTSGIVGYGCAAPDVPVTGETPEMVKDAIKDIVIPYLRKKNPFTYARIIAELKPLLAGKSSTLAMVDMALFDLMSKKADVPLYQFLGGYQHRIETSITIGICSLKETLQEAEIFTNQGFRILKIKGGLDVEADIERMLELKTRFPKTILRFDGNQGYSVAEAIHFFEQTKKAKIQIFEQPVKVGEDVKLGEVTNCTSIPVMADESLKTLEDSFRLVRNKRVDMINIKLMKVGGILEGRHINSVAKSSKIEAMIGCIDECALGIAAGLHFALSRPNIQFADLDGHLDFENDPFSGLFHLKNGWLSPTNTAGLGAV